MKNLKSLIVILILASSVKSFAESVTLPLVGGQLEQCVLSADQKNMELKYVDYVGNATSTLFSQVKVCEEARDLLIKYIETDFPRGFCGCSHVDNIDYEGFDEDDNYISYKGPGFQGQCMQLSVFVENEKVVGGKMFKTISTLPAEAKKNVTAT